MLTFATLLACVAFGSGCQRAPSPAAAETTILPVAATLVRRQTSFSYPVTYFGRIRPARQAALSFEIPGKLVDVLFDEGDRVPADKVVARLDTAALAAEREVLLSERKTESLLLERLQRGEREEIIAAAQAEVRRLEVERKRALAEKNRAETVFESRSITRSEYDQARYTYEATEFSLEQAKQRLQELVSGSRMEDIGAQASRVAAIDARIGQLNVQVDKSSLKTPFESVIVQRHQDEGVSLSPGQVVLEVHESHQLEARFSVPPEAVPLVSQSTFLEVNGTRLSATNPRTLARVDGLTRTVDVIFPLGADSHASLLPGSACSLQVVKRVPARCIEVPVTALVASVRGLWSCYRLQPLGENASIYTVEKVEVSILHTDGVRAIVESALPDESLIVATGVHRLVPGIQVRTDDPQP
ncbi:efflux RND transporter periplasmic adaptor subunit [Roseimaritima ulvae]|uniref:Putative efflux pump membrane fusion protein n=1 Tax=Roseimaritima ulvae TaxID=980254 RepID=A0A5B9QTZ3_9BACT|nr:hypothetical protein [Roseimaritima ulvae]QEG42527.1 putative efflux pump membrane fusion protein [Roseimaritima ulvae]